MGGFLITALGELKGLRKTIYLLEEEGHFDFNLLNSQAGLLDEEDEGRVRRHIKAQAGLFSLNCLTPYLLGGLLLLGGSFPERQGEMKTSLLRAFDFLPPPHFNISYSESVKEGETPKVHNVSEFPLWIRWHGTRLGPWQYLEPGAEHTERDISEIETLEVSLRYQKKDLLPGISHKDYLAAQSG